MRKICHGVFYIGEDQGSVSAYVDAVSLVKKKQKTYCISPRTNLGVTVVEYLKVRLSNKSLTASSGHKPRKRVYG